MNDQIDWNKDGVPVSQRFDDPYYSLQNGLAETHHVFLAGNDLPARFRDGFHIAELGFGTGLNLLAALALWRKSGVQGRLRFTSFEAFPLDAKQMGQAHGAFPEVSALGAEVMEALTPHGAQLDDLDFNLIQGDARQTLPQWDGKADAWFLDGFSPAKNPELWGDDLLAEVGAHTAPVGTCATYTAAGHVRRALGAAGFEITRAPGFGRKRHMSRGVLRA